MLPTGIIRKLDNLGRVVLPAEVRSRLNLTPDSDIQFYLEGSCIVIKKEGCLLCGNVDAIQTEAGLFCRDCQAKVAREIPLQEDSEPSEEADGAV